MNATRPAGTCSPSSPSRGVSLMEVLISIFVMAFGLLGLAALLPVGQFAIVQSNKADRSGACGRAALRHVKVRRLLAPENLANDPGSGPFAIDPLGGAGALGVIPRVNLSDRVGTPEEIFRWRDDLTFVKPKYMDPAPADDSERPRAVLGNNGVQSEGAYSWFLTVTPSAAERALPAEQRRVFSVSAVVCYRRGATQGVTVAKFLGGGYGGGSVELSEPVTVHLDEWIMLGDEKNCHWYRIVCASGNPTTLLTLVGPDWNTQTSPTPTAVVIEGVVGVYSTTIKLDESSLWQAGVWQ